MKPLRALGSAHTRTIGGAGQMPGLAANEVAAWTRDVAPVGVGLHQEQVPTFVDDHPARVSRRQLTVVLGRVEAPAYDCVRAIDWKTATSVRPCSNKSLTRSSPEYFMNFSSGWRVPAAPCGRERARSSRSCNAPGSHAVLGTRVPLVAVGIDDELTVPDPHIRAAPAGRGFAAAVASRRGASSTLRARKWRLAERMARLRHAGVDRSRMSVCNVALGWHPVRRSGWAHGRDPSVR